jgi:hypothetical protein
VITGVDVGPHAGYAITYFTEAPVTGLPGVNTWGASFHWVRKPDGTWGWDAAEEWVPDHDGDLGGWIERGKVAWIAPGDTDLELRDATDGCPYLGLEGHVTVARIQFGEVTYPDPPPAWHSTLGRQSP